MLNLTASHYSRAEQVRGWADSICCFDVQVPESFFLFDEGVKPSASTSTDNVGQIQQGAGEFSRLPFMQNISWFSWVIKVGKRTEDQNFKALRDFTASKDEEKHSESVLSLLQQDSCDRLFKHSWEQLNTPGPVLSSWAASDWLTYIIYWCPEPQNIFFFCTLQAFPIKGGIYNPSGFGVISPLSQQRVPGRN